MKRSIKCFKCMVLIVRQTRVIAYFPYATSILRTAVLYFRLALLNAFRRQKPCLAQAPTQPHCSYQSPTGRRSCWNNMAPRKHHRYVSKYNFFDSLVIFRHYFTGNGKVSCILATISDWFSKRCVVVFFSYRTKHESPAGDQFWKCSRRESQFRTL